MRQPSILAGRPSGAVARAYGRVLAAWAQDALRLRRAGLDRPTARERGAWTDVGVGRSNLATRTGRSRLAG